MAFVCRYAFKALFTYERFKWYMHGQILFAIIND